MPAILIAGISRQPVLISASRRIRRTVVLAGIARIGVGRSVFARAGFASVAGAGIGFGSFASRITAGVASRITAGVASRITAGVAPRITAGVSSWITAGVASRVTAGVSTRRLAGIITGDRPCGWPGIVGVKFSHHGAYPSRRHRRALIDLFVRKKCVPIQCDAAQISVVGRERLALLGGEDWTFDGLRFGRNGHHQAKRGRGQPDGPFMCDFHDRSPKLLRENVALHSMFHCFGNNLLTSFTR
jgi:hypothetical protein